MKNITVLSNKMLKEMIDEFNNSESFLLSYHPLSEGFMIKSTEYLSKIDCYHPNKIAHEHVYIIYVIVS